MRRKPEKATKFEGQGEKPEMAPDNSNMNDGEKDLGIGLGMFKSYTIIDNLQYCLLGC